MYVTAASFYNYQNTVYLKTCKLLRARISAHGASTKHCIGYNCHWEPGVQIQGPLYIIVKTDHFATDFKIDRKSSRILSSLSSASNDKLPPFPKYWGDPPSALAA